MTAMLFGTCPLWVISGHSSDLSECPLYRRKPTSKSPPCLLWARSGHQDFLVHPTIPTLPIGITKTALQNFTGTRFGQRLTADHHRSGHLVSADMLPAYGH